MDLSNFKTWCIFLMCVPTMHWCVELQTVSNDAEAQAEVIRDIKEK